MCPQLNWTDWEAGPALVLEGGSKQSKEPGVFRQTLGGAQGESGREHSSVSTQPLSGDQ